MTGKIKKEHTHYRCFFYNPYPLSRARPKERPPVGERPLSQYLCHFYSFTQEMAVLSDRTNITEADCFKNILVRTLLLEAEY